jgi:hypothetical protein
MSAKSNIAALIRQFYDDTQTGANAGMSFDEFFTYYMEEKKHPYLIHVEVEAWSAISDVIRASFTTTIGLFKFLKEKNPGFRIDVRYGSERWFNFSELVRSFSRDYDTCIDGDKTWPSFFSVHHHVWDEPHPDYTLVTVTTQGVTSKAVVSKNAADHLREAQEQKVGFSRVDLQKDLIAFMGQIIDEEKFAEHLVILVGTTTLPSECHLGEHMHFTFDERIGKVYDVCGTYAEFDEKPVDWEWGRAPFKNVIHPLLPDIVRDQ